MIGAENVRFEVSDKQGDPGKLKYLHDPNATLPIHATNEIKVDPRACPGCMFGTPLDGKWPHVKDARCKLWKEAA